MRIQPTLIAALAILATPPAFAQSAATSAAPAARPAAAAATLPGPALMPLPRSVQWRAGDLAVRGAFAVTVRGPDNPLIARAIERFQADMAIRTGLSGPTQGPPLIVEVAADEPGTLSVRMREGYRLSVTADAVTLRADGPVGVLRGLATLRQMVAMRGNGFALPQGVIADSPRFIWRGLMIDTVRHFMDLPTLRRQIDAMERLKLNVLHLHLSDNEGFRVESRAYPRLTQAAGAQFYTQEEVRALVAYAADRGVRIVPEFDVPAHTGAILAAYPELAASQFDPTNRIAMFSVAMDPTRQETYDFIERLFTEMAALFPDAYFHVGGDEVSPAAWSRNPAIVDYMRANGIADRVAMQDIFFQRVKTIIERIGKTPMGWEEVAHNAVDDRVLVQSWRSSEALHHVTAQGNPTILSAGYYLDLLWPGMKVYAIDPQDSLATPPNLPSERLAPAPTAPLSAAQRQLVWGAEAPLWAETVSSEMIDGRMWPRAALLAERFWSPADVRDPDDAARRVVPVQEQLRLYGLQDDANRRRMAARLSPEGADAVVTLADVTAPVRNMGRLADVFAALRTAQPIIFPDLNQLVDVAAPDSLAVYRLQAMTAAYIHGDRSQHDALVAALTVYRDNHARFIRAAEGNAALTAALPISEDVRALADTALQAIAMQQQGTRPSPEWIASARALIERQHAAAAASSSIPRVMSGAQQPPAKLLILLTPITERLVAVVAP
jgi:hexosaminidase